MVCITTARVPLVVSGTNSKGNMSESVVVEVLQSRIGLSDELLPPPATNSNEPTCANATVDSAVASSSNNKQLFVMFTGNPGMVHFYIELSQLLVRYAREGSRIGVPFSHDGPANNGKGEEPQPV